MKIGFVIVFVSDFDKSFDFYTNKLGMPLDYTDKNGWAQFHAGEDISLAIERCDPNRVELGSKLVGRLVGVTLIVTTSTTPTPASQTRASSSQASQKNNHGAAHSLNSKTLMATSSH
jgi:catechol 2,3-dioxygenase-like lactoylglutathione lyase family enzyme